MRGLSALDPFAQYHAICDIGNGILAQYATPPTMYMWLEDACMDLQAFNAMPMFVAGASMLVTIAGDNYSWTRLHRLIAKNARTPRFTVQLQPGTHAVGSVDLVQNQADVESPKAGNFLTLPPLSSHTRFHAPEELPVVAHHVFLAGKFTMVAADLPPAPPQAVHVGQVAEAQPPARATRRCCVVS